MASPFYYCVCLLADQLRTTLVFAHTDIRIEDALANAQVLRRHFQQFVFFHELDEILARFRFGQAIYKPPLLRVRYSMLYIG